MELELGLALPGTCAPSKPHDVDANRIAYVAAAAGAPPCNMKKRCFDEAFDGDEDPTATLPLFVWTSAGVGEHIHGDSNGIREADRSLPDKQSSAAGANSPVGWPPVKWSWRNASGGTKHVKVRMEGMPIGRKLDLSLHRSYATLLDAVDRLFLGNHHEAQEGLRPASPAASRSNRTFTYQLGNGDWMLVGDVPWEAFVKSVKRIKVFSHC